MTGRRVVEGEALVGNSAELAVYPNPSDGSVKVSLTLAYAFDVTVAV